MDSNKDIISLTGTNDFSVNINIPFSDKQKEMFDLDISIPSTPILKNVIKEVDSSISRIPDLSLKNVSLKVEDEITKDLGSLTSGIDKLKDTDVGKGTSAVLNYLASQQNKIKNIVSQKEDSKTSTPNKFKSISPQVENVSSHTIQTSENKRVRKIDRKALFSELCSELPITLKYTEGNLDGNDTVQNYAHEWKQWYEVDETDEIKELIDELKNLEEKYKKMGKFNTNVDKGIQFSLLVLGSGVVYVEASKASTDVISKWNIVAGALTTFATIVYNFFKFNKKGPHYITTSNNLRKLRSWIESKMILPIDKRFSPFDIYSMGFKAYQSIIEEAASINDSK